MRVVTMRVVTMSDAVSGDDDAVGGDDDQGDGQGAGHDYNQVGDESHEPAGGPRSLGQMIRDQRELAELTMRQFASMVGISNPYLSQIERGLREPSEKVLGAIAENLHLSADLLTSAAGKDGPNAVVAAISADPDLTAAQRRSLLETYEAYREITIHRRRRPGAGGRPV